MPITRLPNMPMVRRQVGASPVRRLPAERESPQPWYARYLNGPVVPEAQRLAGQPAKTALSPIQHKKLGAPPGTTPQQQRLFAIPQTSILFQPPTETGGGYGLSPGPYSFWGSTFGPGTEPLTAIMAGIQSIAVANPDIDVWSLIADYPVDISDSTSIVNASRALMNEAMTQTLGDPEKAVIYAINKISNSVNQQKASTEAAAQTYGLTAEDVMQLFQNFMSQMQPPAEETPETEEPHGPVLLPSYTQGEYGFWPSA